MPPATILVVDDDDVILALVRRVLERAGYAVRGATDGHEGLRILFAERPDLVVLDIGLPRHRRLAGAGASSRPQRRAGPDAERPA